MTAPQVIWNAKRTILANRVQIDQALKRRDVRTAAQLRKQNDDIRQSVMQKFAVWIDY